MKTVNKILFMVLVIVGLGSCIKEDLDGCFSDITLLMSYKGDGTSEIFNEKIRNAVLYVFDENKNLTTTLEVSERELKERRVVLPDLPLGDYRVICFGNTGNSRTNDLGGADYSQMHYAAKEYFENKTIRGNDSLYYSSLTLTVTGEDVTKTLDFASSHYKVVVEVAGIVEGSRYPTIEWSGVLPYTDFENRAGGEPTDYILDTEYRNGMLQSRTNIMRHSDHAGVDIILRAPDGSVLAEVNLADFLKAHPEVDCSKQEVLIPLRFEFKAVGVEITLPDWYVEHVKPEF